LQALLRSIASFWWGLDFGRRFHLHGHLLLIGMMACPAAED
jgi:hypothetical protein